MTEEDAIPGASLVTPAAIQVDVRAANRRECIEHLVDLAAATGRVSDCDAAMDAVLDREAEAPTGVGGGVAVPHARTDAIDRPTLAFVRLRNGADFGGPSAADLLFLLLIPEGGDDVHLETLRRLSRRLLGDSLGERLRGADSAREVTGVLREVVE